MQLIEAARAWGTKDFEATLVRELERLGRDGLPLQQGLSRSSYALGDRPRVLINGTAEEEGLLVVRAGVFYRGIIAGCSCADDPTPVDEMIEYCEIKLEIDMRTGEATLSLV